MSAAEAEAELTALKRLFRFLQDERAIYPEWERLVTSLDVKGKKTHDARLVAAMTRHGVTHLLTFNVVDFRRYSSIAILPPGEVVAGVVPL